MLKISFDLKIRMPLVLITCCFVINTAYSSEHNFLQSRGNELYLDSLKFTELSVNKFDLFNQFVLEDIISAPPNQKQKALQALKDIGDNGFRIIRVNCSPFWAGWWEKSWFDNDPIIQKQKRDQFLKRFDEMLDACDENNIRIVASLCWYVGNLADLGHHSLHEGIVNPDSPGRHKIQEYISIIVNRYKNRTTIAMWEIGNEWNLRADIQKPSGTLQPVPQSLAPLPVVRDERNNYTSDELAECVRQIATLIKSIDHNHLVTTGHSSPRPAAMHLLRAVRNGQKKDWTQDSEQELEEYLRLSHPDPIDVISVHFYTEAMTALGKKPGDISNLYVYKRIADKIGKPLMLGEIGLYDGIGRDYTNSQAMELVQRQLKAITKAGIPLTMYWTYSDDTNRKAAADGEYHLQFGRTDNILKLFKEAY